MVFTVSCPECHSEFPVDSAKVPEAGVYAQCSVCPESFLVERPVEEAAAEAPDAFSNDLAGWSGPDADSGEAGQSDDASGFDDAYAATTAVEAHDHTDDAGDSADGAEAEEPQVAVATPAFGQTDPDSRAARLARVLVSDMMTYNPAMYDKAVESGSLVEDFEDEVKRSWSEYVEQVGEDLAGSTPHFTNALNDILAKGEVLFDETMYE